MVHNYVCEFRTAKFRSVFWEKFFDVIVSLFVGDGDVEQLEVEERHVTKVVGGDDGIRDQTMGGRMEVRWTWRAVVIFRAIHPTPSVMAVERCGWRQKCQNDRWTREWIPCLRKGSQVARKLTAMAGNCKIRQTKVTSSPLQTCNPNQPIFSYCAFLQGLAMSVMKSSGTYLDCFLVF